MLKKLFIVYLKFNFYCVFCIFACSTVRLAVAVSGEGANIKMNKPGCLRVRVDWPMLRPPTHFQYCRPERG